MNDFTQEELVLMGCWSVNRYDQVGSDQAKDEGTISLSHKIQAMIDNYCEHKSIRSFTDVDYVQLCGDCHELTGWL